MTSVEGSFDGGSGNADQGTGENSSPVTSPDSGQSQELSYNPAWEPVFEKLPQEFHPMIKPTLETWDRNYQTLQKEYEPWKQLGDYEQVQRNLTLVQELNNDPQAFYERLGQLIGVTPKQAQQFYENDGQEQNQGYPPGSEGDDEDLMLDPEVLQLKQTVAQLQQQNQTWQQEREQAEQQRQVAEYQAKADAHIQRLATQHQQNYPTIPFNPAEVVQRVLLQTYQEPNKEPDIDRAYQDYLSLVTSVRAAPRPGNSAPSVVNPNGGGMPPSDQLNPATASSEQRKKMVADFLARQNSV
jgi:hypothetical protein